jgi:hypothetical protein
MVANEWEFSFNGLSFGGALDIGIRNVDGLNPPESRADITTKQGDHGSFIFAEFLTERHVTIEGDIVGTPGTDFAGKVNSWRSAFQPQDSPIPLSFKLPGEGAKRIYCVPARRDLPVDFGYNIGNGSWAVELLAEDPRIYDDTEDSLSTNVASASGVDFDIDFDFNFGGGTGGQVSCANDGIIATYPVVRFTGPCTDPMARNITTGLDLKLVTTIASGDYIDVDFLARTIMLNDVASRYNVLDSTSEFWGLQPGANTVQFIASTTDSNTLMTVMWRSAWI